MHPSELRIADLTYDLPQDRIAQAPLADRDAAKLLFRSADGLLRDKRFADLPDCLPQGALLVLNDTRVIHARIRFQRSSGALIECMVLEPEHGRVLEEALQDKGRSRWWCMVGNAKRWKADEVLCQPFPGVLSVAKKDHAGDRYLLDFTWNSDATFVEVMAAHGLLPLPPYMKRSATDEDDVRYNTVFAARNGSVAAPTASLHFTKDVLQRLKQSGIRMEHLTLHVGAGTFQPVKSERMAGHTMHREEVRVPRKTIEALLRQVGDPIIPVGTTAMRTLESLCWFGDELLDGATLDRLSVTQWQPYDKRPHDTRQALEAVLSWMDQRHLDVVTGATSLLIAPGYSFRLVTGLVTNFHQPGSTLLLLVAALLGDGWRDVYAHALANDYRFLSYGDSSLLLPSE